MCRHQGFDTGRLKGASDFQLSVGKIVDTLQADYLAWFERSPNFDIYDESIVFEMGLITGRQLSELQGKRAYCRLILGLQRLATLTVREGKVKCSVQPWSTCDYTLRVNWSCNGQLAYQPLHISAISAYSVAPKAALSVPAQLPWHLIDRHKIEFLEIHPPSLKYLLRGVGWKPQMQHPEPALASKSFLRPSRPANGWSQASPFEAEARLSLV